MARSSSGSGGFREGIYGTNVFSLLHSDFGFLYLF